MPHSPHPEDSPASAPDAGPLERALSLVRFLRANCDWDRRQTPLTLIPHLLEETHETIDAILEGDQAALEGELGDLLLNLAFQLVLAEEAGAFTAEAVVTRLEEKMRRRHPHLYGEGEARGWEHIKAEERKESEGVLEGLSRGLDPMTRAFRIQDKVAGVGFDWPDFRGAGEKVEEELEEVLEALRDRGAAAVEEELGDLLFAVINLVRLGGGHPTVLLETANRKFERRFKQLEALARERGIRLEEAGLARLDQLWDEIKATEPEG